ncbi:hypothetical protein B0H13DRAFT_2666233 [Mycena leptocephala]|nr:hypothetical protein B0H13DRAFT_2666233 [Mycena leptocephala]
MTTPPADPKRLHSFTFSSPFAPKVQGFTFSHTCRRDTQPFPPAQLRLRLLPPAPPVPWLSAPRRSILPRCSLTPTTISLHLNPAARRRPLSPTPNPNLPGPLSVKRRPLESHVPPLISALACSTAKHQPSVRVSTPRPQAKLILSRYSSAHVAFIYHALAHHIPASMAYPPPVPVLRWIRVNEAPVNLPTRTQWTVALALFTVHRTKTLHDTDHMLRFWLGTTSRSSVPRVPIAVFG